MGEEALKTLLGWGGGGWRRGRRGPQPARSGPETPRLTQAEHTTSFHPCLRKAVHLHLRPICLKLQNTCHIASWHRSQMFARKRTDSYIPLGVVIFRRVILHLEEKAALRQCVCSALHEASGPRGGAGVGRPGWPGSVAACWALSVRAQGATSCCTTCCLSPGSRSRGRPGVYVSGNWVTLDLELEDTAGPPNNDRTLSRAPGRVAGGLASLQGSQAGKN